VRDDLLCRSVQQICREVVAGFREYPAQNNKNCVSFRRACGKERIQVVGQNDNRAGSYRASLAMPKAGQGCTNLIKQS
jgi:hypothetical protein